MSQKHTPGPWEKVELGVIGNKITSNGNFYVHATVDTENEELEANSRLIAAAPELLQLLIEYVGPYRIDGKEWLERAEATIKKATI